MINNDTNGLTKEDVAGRFVHKFERPAGAECMKADLLNWFANAGYEFSGKESGMNAATAARLLSAAASQQR